MPELYDEDGNPVEALSKEEAEAAIEAAKAEAAEALSPKIKELEEQLEKAKDKETNFAKLRTKTEAQEGQESGLKEQIAAMEAKLEEAKNSGVSSYLNTVVEDEIERLSDGDMEFEDQLRKNYDLLNMSVSTKSDVRERVQRAYKMSLDVDDGGTQVNAPSGPGRAIRQTGSDETPSDDLLGFSSRFGLSKEDFDKFGKK